MRNNHSNAQTVHDELVARVFYKLKKQHNKNLEAFVLTSWGELDIVKYDDNGMIDTIYEIKCHPHPRRYMKARQQLHRAWNVYHNTVNCVFVSQDDDGNLIAERMYRRGGKYDWSKRKD